MAKNKRARQTDMLVLDTALRELSVEGDCLEKFDRLIDWESFRPVLEQSLNRGERPEGGRPPFDEVLMFKVLVLKKLHGMSDAQVAYQVKDRVSWWRFLGLEHGGRKPDEKTVWKFGNDLTEAGAMDRLWDLFSNYLNAQGLRATQGQIIDSTLVSAPRQRLGELEREQVKAGVKPAGWSEAKMRQTDADARWTVKQGPDRADESGQIKKGVVVPSHGYKNHVCVDGKYKLVRKSKVTDAASHDSRHLPELLDEDNASKKVRTDSAYQSRSNNEAIASKGLRPFIIAKKPRGRPMPRQVARRNAAISKVRSRGEHPFAEFKCRLKLAVRTKGLKRADFQIRMTNLVYNMKRFVYLMGTAASA